MYIAVADHTHQLQEPPKACSYTLLQGREKGYSTKAEFDDSASRKQLYDPHCPLSASPALRVCACWLPYPAVPLMDTSRTPVSQGSMQHLQDP